MLVTPCRRHNEGASSPSRAIVGFREALIVETHDFQIPIEDAQSYFAYIDEYEYSFDVI